MQGCRQRRSAAGLALVGALALAAGCSTHTPGGTAVARRAPSPPTAPTAAVPGWSRPVAVAPGVPLTDVACPAAGTCVAVSSTGSAFRLDQGRWGPATALGGDGAPSAGSSLSCPTVAFCLALPSPDQWSELEGTAWSAPRTVAAAQGLGAVGCATPTFCVAIDGEGNAFTFDGAGWSATSGAWGSASAISCPVPTFCVAAEGGPSLWDGRSWTEPSPLPGSGQLTGVSCTGPAFCVIVDSSGQAYEWNGSAWLGPVALGATAPAPGLSTATGLTGVSCASAVSCVAVGAAGQAYAFGGVTWSPPRHVDPGHSLSAVSCAGADYCVAVDRQGYAVTFR